MMLEEKIANEFQRYFLSMMATSKENIFAHSDEIEVRKQIKNELYEFIGTLNEEQKEILSVQSSLIESVFRYRRDFYSTDDDIPYQDFLNGWIQSADFYGCMFINACAEYASPENPLHIQAAAHKEAVQAVLLARFQAAGFSQAEAMAALLFIGGEGLIVSAQTGGTQHIGRYGDLIRQAVAAHSILGDMVI